MKAAAPFALPLLLAGCVAYEPAPVEWAAEAARLGAAPRRLALSVADVRARAVAFSPELNALRLAHAASTAKADAAGWWEDPSLDVDWLRILQEPENPIVWGASLSFTLPLSGIPAVEKRAAEAYADADRWALVAAERTAAGEAAGAAVTARELARVGDAVARTLAATNYLAARAVVARLVDAGEVARVEAEQLDAEAREWARTARELAAERAAAEAPLRRTLLLSPTCEIVWQGSEGAAPFPTNAYTCLAFTNAPSVRAAVRRLAGGEAELDREIRRQYPELSAGPAYSREEGFNRVGFVTGLTLPLWNRNRVGIAEARGTRDAARQAAVEAWREAVYAWQALQDEAARLPDVPPVTSAEAAGRLYAAGELDAPGYLGAVHRSLAEAVAAARVRIARGVLAARMQSVVEGLNEKEEVK